MITDKIRRSFALQLVVFIFIFTIIIFAMMFLVQTAMTKRIMTNNAEQIAKNLTWESINKIEGILRNIENITFNTAYLLGNQLLSQSEQKEYIRNIIIRNDEIVSVSVLYTQKQLIDRPNLKSYTYFLQNGSYNFIDETMNVAEYSISDWFMIPEYNKNGYWSEPRIEVATGFKPITSYSYPLFEKGQLIGIVRTNVSLLVLQQIVSSVRLLNSGYAIMISNNGTFITHPADSLILNYSIFSYAEQIEMAALHSVGKDMILGKSRFVKLSRNRNYPNKWMYFASINMNKWSLGVKFDNNDIMADLYKVNFTLTIILSLGFIILLSAIYSRIKTIFKPMNSLVNATQKIGGGNFDVHLPKIKMDNEVSILTNSISRMQCELKDYMTNLVKTNQEREKIKSEIRFAAQIQQNIIPSNQNLLAYVKEVSIFGILEPAEDIGGDLYDAFLINDTKLCILIADVFGKGIVASMLMTMVQTLIRSQAKYSSSPTSLIKAVNTYLCENNKQANFITLFIGVVNLSTGKMDFCNAGHTPLYLRKSNHDLIRYGETHCTALGIFPDLKINSSSLQLNIQDFIILFTDGVTEALSDREEFYGYTRLEEILKAMQNPTPEIIVKSILSSVREFTGLEKQRDDLSIIVLRFNHPKAN